MAWDQLTNPDFWAGLSAGVALACLAWLLQRRSQRRELAELARVIDYNLENLFSDKSIRSFRDARLTQGLAGLLDKWLPQLRTENAESRRQMRQLRIVLESMTEGVVAIDSRLRVILANPAAQPLLGIDKTSLGKLLPEVIRNAKLLEFAAHSVLLADSEEAEIVVTTRDGVGRPISRTVDVRIAPILRRFSVPRGSDEPAAAGAVLVVQDVTELRHLERMRQDFVTNASHELKTPLTSIKLYAESLLDWALDDPAQNRDFVARIEEQTQRLIDLVADMLSLSKLESGQEVYRQTSSAIEPQLRSRVASYQDKASHREIELVLQLQNLPSGLLVNAAEEAIRQVLDNLIGNALKFTPSGGHVQVRAVLASPDWLEIQVVDTGIGIPKDDLEKVFERFYRVDKARSRDMGGTGLGLAIVKHIVQSTGGEVGVESMEGLGSTFRVTLPVVQAPRILPAASA
jgi:two-component system phosphate regulon sensor histidine kinase PhoR